MHDAVRMALTEALSGAEQERADVANMMADHPRLRGLSRMFDDAEERIHALRAALGPEIEAPRVEIGPAVTEHVAAPTDRPSMLDDLTDKPNAQGFFRRGETVMHDLVHRQSGHGAFNGPSANFVASVCAGNARAPGSPAGAVATIGAHSHAVLTGTGGVSCGGLTVEPIAALAASDATLAAGIDAIPGCSVAHHTV